MHALVLGLAGIASLVSAAPRATVPHAPAAPAAAAVLKQVCEAHNGLRSYRAKGTLRTQVALAGKGECVFEAHTTLALDRSGSPRGALRSTYGRSVCDGKRFLRYQAVANVYTIESAPDMLPGYLFRLPYGRQVTQGSLTSLLLMPDLSLKLGANRLGSARIVDDDKSKPGPLVHLQAKTSMGVVTDLWIDRDSHLIRRYRLTYTGRRPSSRGLTIIWAEEAHHDVHANQPIPDDLFAIDIPQGQKVDRLPPLPHLAELAEKQLRSKARPGGAASRPKSR